jgi:hypothetical protein
MAEEKEVQDQEQEVDLESQEKDIELEIEDDTPEQDRGRQPLPEEMVKELEEDELEDYSEKVKTRLKQMKKVWHDERRAKESALREQQEAISLTQKLMDENKKLKGRLSEGEKSLISTATSAAELEMEMAKRAYKEAYDSGDTDKIVEAQEKLNNAGYRLQRLKGYKPPLQQEDNGVQNQQVQPQAPQLDQKTAKWRRQNTWFGQDEEMTAAALGLHQKLEKQYGSNYIGTDEYWSTVDKTMKRRFPDYFGEDDEAVEAKPQRTEKPATVVAPASRSTAPKKVVLKQSQIALAKKLGLTPEQYAKEYAKTMGA